MLDSRFVPWWGEDTIPRVPPYPSRLRAFIYGCAMVAHEDAVKLAGGSTGGVKQQKQQRARR